MIVLCVILAIPMLVFAGWLNRDVGPMTVVEWRECQWHKQRAWVEQELNDYLRREHGMPANVRFRFDEQKPPHLTPVAHEIMDFLSTAANWRSPLDSQSPPPTLECRATDALSGSYPDPQGQR